MSLMWFNNTPLVKTESWQPSLKNDVISHLSHQTYSLTIGINPSQSDACFNLTLTWRSLQRDSVWDTSVRSVTFFITIDDDAHYQIGGKVGQNSNGRKKKERVVNESLASNILDVLAWTCKSARGSVHPIYLVHLSYQQSQRSAISGHG